MESCNKDTNRSLITGRGDNEHNRTAASKHLAILKAADLVIDRKMGRETRYRLNVDPLEEVKDWVSFYEKFWNERAALLKNLLEK
jgi:DNA-binding transcriptional ArsR family regulator